ncbi:hypothetical protein [Streptomyces ardesiacus]|uniref:hypothetical protein n=1 Tax=Streptomyces ardesiacus TaxID=285564 RepID=UPI003F4A1D57
MPAPALHPDILIAKYETIRCWTDLEASRHEKLHAWNASRLDDGTLFLSARITGPNPGRALQRFADRHAGYLSRRPQTPGDQLPALDVSVEGREACVWRTGGVWVELWHPIPAPAAGDRPEPRPAGTSRPPRRGLPGARLPFGRRSKTTTP